MYCLYCNKETFNPKFCNSSCCAKYNNKKPRKYKGNLQGKCVKCGEPTNKKLFHCRECMPQKVNFDDYTLGQVKESTGKQYSNRIRERSRGRLKKQKQIIPCQNCGYEKFVEVCHIKPIHEFTDDTLIAEINADENIVILCPNCHWEFDNGLLCIDKTLDKFFIPEFSDDDKCRVCKKPYKERYIPYPSERKPPKEQLEKEIKEIDNWSALGRKYNVTCNTVRKWARGYGLL